MKTKLIRRHYFFPVLFVDSAAKLTQVFQRVYCFLAPSVSCLHLDKVSNEVASAYVPSSKAAFTPSLCNESRQGCVVPVQQGAVVQWVGGASHVNNVTGRAMLHVVA